MSLPELSSHPLVPPHPLYGFAVRAGGKCPRWLDFPSDYTATISGRDHNSTRSAFASSAAKKMPAPSCPQPSATIAHRVHRHPPRPRRPCAPSVALLARTTYCGQPALCAISVPCPTRRATVPRLRAHPNVANDELDGTLACTQVQSASPSPRAVHAAAMPHSPRRPPPSSHRLQTSRGNSTSSTRSHSATALANPLYERPRWAFSKAHKTSTHAHDGPAQRRSPYDAVAPSPTSPPNIGHEAGVTGTKRRPQ
ncbi:hypothetical protein B0H13DRAFT_1887820 [Mycena leptocephala]|nr:hypothetical protein B0H13DRAFT_1887820 [Mycena leptocephala]